MGGLERVGRIINGLGGLEMGWEDKKRIRRVINGVGGL